MKTQEVAYHEIPSTMRGPGTHRDSLIVLPDSYAEPIIDMMIRMWGLSPSDTKFRRVLCHVMAANYGQPTAFMLSVEGSPPRGTILCCMDYPSAVTICQGESKTIRRRADIEFLTMIGRRGLKIASDCGV